ncbi:substrate-binding periplasmic protein [Pseudodesulfovibrio sp.]|uniref:substrate-binding periplasmic protein n=1 Tax=unclassified Pseudodesulfovibrio TaxID=2661612 RepID=UPI003B0036AA
MTLRLLSPLFFLLLIPSAASAFIVKEVVTTSPAWNTLTNSDGSGLYHEVLRSVFALYDISVRHEYATSNRAEELVQDGDADMMICNIAKPQSLKLARYPLYQNDFFAFYNKTHIGTWQGNTTLLGKEILVQPGYYSAADFPVPVNLREVLTGVQAVSMILMNRADFYVDDLALIKGSLKENSIAYDSSQFTIKQVGTRTYFPLFNTTPRAHKIREMYEEGMLRLFREGKLSAIYEKWGYRLPDLNTY